MKQSFDHIVEAVKECGKKTVAVSVAQDSAVLEAVKAAKERGIADAILVGDEAKIREIAASVGIDDPVYLNKLFHKNYRISPKEYRNKYKS